MNYFWKNHTYLSIGWRLNLTVIRLDCHVSWDTLDSGHFLICLLGHPGHFLICLLGHPVHFLICLDLTQMFQFLKIETFPQFLVTHFSLLTTLFSVYFFIDFLIFILGEVVFNTNEQKTATVGRVPRVNRMSSFYGDLNSSSATLER